MGREHHGSQFVTASARHPGRRRWVLAFLAAALAVAIGPFGAALASAATTSGAQTRVGASTSAGQVLVGASASVSAGQRLGKDLPQPGIVVATGVAANTASNAAASTVRVGPGAALENITGGEVLRIQNAANRIGQPISLVGSRATGEAGGVLRLGLRDHRDQGVDPALGVEFAPSRSDGTRGGASDRRLQGSAG